MSRRLPRSRSPMVTVRLPARSWDALVHFVTGDLHNMEDSEIKSEMTQIIEAIQVKVASSPAAPEAQP